MSAEPFQISGCEVCGNSNLTPVLDLGSHPMCDDLVPIDSERVCKEYPIRILYCEQCRTANQQYQVPKQDLFPSNYHYRSRFTTDVLNGMHSLVTQCEYFLGGLERKLVLDIGCNDGSLLSFFRERGANTCGVEPTGAYLDAEISGHKVYNDYFDPCLAEKILADQGNPDLIVFTNVFAHIEDLRTVLESLNRLITTTTVVVIENHYLGAILEGNQFDTFYHEHPRTYSCSSFKYISKSLGLPLSHIEFPSRYGGNIRVILGSISGDFSESKASLVSRAIAREDGFLRQFEDMRRNMEMWRSVKKEQLELLVQKFGPIAAKAFPGRAAILTKLLGLDTDMIDRVYEKSGSMKIGHYVPGTRIPIVSDEELLVLDGFSAPLLNFAWHISDEIRGYMTERGYSGEIIDIVDKQN